MKLITNAIEKALFSQFKFGADLKIQNVVAKIFNPTGGWTWYLVNSDPDDPDYIWAIVDGFENEVGSVSRKELESYKGRFGLGLERDLFFPVTNASTVWESIQKGVEYEKGGVLDQIELYGNMFVNKFGVAGDKFQKAIHLVKRSTDDTLEPFDKIIAKVNAQTFKKSLGNVGSQVMSSIKNTFGNKFEYGGITPSIAARTCVGSETWENLSAEERKEITKGLEFYDYGGNVMKANAFMVKGGLFDMAKPQTKTTAKTKERTSVEIHGIGEDIASYEAIVAIINNAEAQKEILGGKLKELAKEKFLEMYEKNKRKPENFNLKDDVEEIMFIVMDKYKKVEPEKAALLEQFDGLLETTTKFVFNNAVLERNKDIIEKAIMGAKGISDADKQDLIVAETTQQVKKGSIDRLMDYDNPSEIFDLIQPIVALK